MKRFVLLLALVGCAKDGHHDSDQAATKPTDPSAPLPEFKVKPVDETEAQDLATLKQRTQSMVSKWLTEQPTADGWIVTYEIPKKEWVQDDKTLKVEAKETGVDFGVYVRRQIDGKPYKCVTTHITKREDIARVVDACKTAKPTE
ncbi:MAG TPA: hypothetical protein VL326_24305 [Kofleriaceae bacterium]|nr:hypothetical protein [Kofleriaceae bacterium]